MNKKSLLAGIVLGIAVVVSLGIVYIDTTKNFWNVAGGFVRLVVNTNAQATITVDTNTLRVGINTNNITVGTHILAARKQTNVTTSPAPTANSPGGLVLNSADGGDTTIPTTGIGGVAGRIEIIAGTGGNAPNATTNATAGAGGTVTINSGNGGANVGGVSTNRSFGGAGGSLSLSGGVGGSPAVDATNTMGGTGGGFTLLAGNGGAPSAGWARQGGNGGTFTLQGGTGGSGSRTNGGNGGGLIIAAGDAGAGGTAPGNPGRAGDLSLSAGGGGTGATNGNGGHIYVRGGNPGSTALPGTIYLARNSSGSARGGVVIGLGEFAITNMIGGAASLDFPDTVAGTFSDLPITVTGTTSNGCSVVLGIPWEMAQLGGGFVHYTSNDTVYVRFLNNQLVTSIDPSPGTVTAIVLKNQ